MVDGDPGADVFAMDVARFGDFTSLRYTNAKVRENYSRRFSIRFPNEELPAARPQQTTPLYDIMVRDNNAVMGDTWGLETPLWFAPQGTPPEDELSFHRSNDFEHVGNEVRAVRERVGITEIANFAKYRISGSSAEAWLNQLLTNTMPATGRIVLSPMLNYKGKLIGDFTIAKADDDVFYLWGSSGAQIYHMRWFEQLLPKDHSVNIHRYGQTIVGLSIAGPDSRRVLEKLVDTDVSNSAFKFMDHHAMDVAGCPCLVNRLTYTGDLGYELWMEPAYERQIYLALKEAGAEFNIVDFGMRALLSMRLEKNFPTWAAELRPIYGPYEGAMERFIKLSTDEFIGKAAAQTEHDNGGTLKRVSFSIDTDNTDVMGDEPIWAKTTTDYGCIEKPHGYGAPRFDTSGRETPKAITQIDGDWRVVGWITSGGYGHFVEKSLAQGYVPVELLKNTETEYQIEILGRRCNAAIESEPPFDPSGSLMRS
jgi:dimethylglycine dehydrogenase